MLGKKKAEHSIECSAQNKNSPLLGRTLPLTSLSRDQGVAPRECPYEHLDGALTALSTRGESRQSRDLQISVLPSLFNPDGPFQSLDSAVDSITGVCG
jgi:hypothetical protein